MNWHDRRYLRRVDGRADQLVGNGHHPACRPEQIVGLHLVEGGVWIFGFPGFGLEEVASKLPTDLMSGYFTLIHGRTHNPRVRAVTIVGRASHREPLPPGLLGVDAPPPSVEPKSIT